uniref:Ketoreductase (KR) domain-containing protein n=1 Tax=Chromera velia CCMP2878 TaxID=1169474 RepID=A0A0G4F6X6_9ALVE|eukprot:Cvel_15507.t1-p1 / transcript=Cvel_15507.t1 / gene=Cvel_15507 / organism=Chromera_velia_CCMP2878 / gene_product=Uncharacterized oxidoreductase AN7799, putative / transcript_product=Uncharacterized oxidoreductase AN7799, putative / location=Cvel_scaffold1151:22651-29551(+) / protein_length=274 / sequence_SO=supercontig / SO=protein_coding / is_pseudo=false
MSSGGDGKTYVITGATDGIGLHTAKRIAKYNPKNKLILHGRNSDRIAKAISAVRQLGCESVFGYEANLLSIQETKDLAERIAKDHPHIDVLLNNAGVFAETPIRSENDLEGTFHCNVVAPYILTCRLARHLPDGTGRLVITSSISQGGSLDLDRVQNLSGHSAYSVSKLADCALALWFAEKLEKRGIKCHTLDPGTVNTKMLLAGWGACGIDVNSADDTFWLAVTDAPIVTENTGTYFVGRAPSRPHRDALDNSKRKALVEYLQKLTGVNPAEV